MVLLGACQSNNRPQPTPAPTIQRSPIPTLTAEIVSLPLTHTTPHVPRERVLQLNKSVEGVYIPNRSQELYSFTLNHPRRIGIVLEAADGGESLNLVTRLYNEAGNLLPQITAQVGQPMMRNEWDLVPGHYSIEIFGVETAARGFTLTVLERPVAESGGGVLAYGETRSGEIRVRGQRDTWTFQGEVGAQVLITMIAPNADAYLELYAPDGHLLARNDDRVGRSPLLNVTLDASGEYSLVARMVDDDQTGAYQIKLEQQDHAED
jgi:hypothetical protein